MSIVNAIIDKYPDTVEVFQVNSRLEFNYLLVHTPSELVLLNPLTLESEIEFDDDDSKEYLFNPSWALSLSFNNLMQYLWDCHITPTDITNKLDFVILEIYQNRSDSGWEWAFKSRYLWQSAFSQVFKPLWRLDLSTEQLSATHSKSSEAGFLYVVQLDAFIKVGFSKNIKARLNQYRTSNLKVELLAKYPCTHSQELEFHRLYNNSSEKYLTDAKTIKRQIKEFLNA